MSALPDRVPKYVSVNFADFCIDCVSVINSKVPDELVGPTVMGLKCEACSPFVRKAITGDPTNSKIPGYCGQCDWNDECDKCAELRKTETFVYLDVILTKPIETNCDKCLGFFEHIKTFNDLADHWRDLCPPCRQIYLTNDKDTAIDIEDFCPNCVQSIKTCSIIYPIGVCVMRLACDKCKPMIRSHYPNVESMTLSKDMLCSMCKPRLQATMKGNKMSMVGIFNTLCTDCCQFILKHNHVDLDVTLPFKMTGCSKHLEAKTYRELNELPYCKDCTKSPSAFPKESASSSSSLGNAPLSPARVIPLNFWIMEDNSKYRMLCSACRGITLENFFIRKPGGCSMTKNLCLRCFADRTDIDLTKKRTCYLCHKNKETLDALLCNTCAGPNGIREKYYADPQFYINRYTNGAGNDSDLKWIMTHCSSSLLFWSDSSLRYDCQYHPEKLYIRAGHDRLPAEWIRAFKNFFNHFLHQYNPRMQSNLGGCTGRSMEYVLKHHPHYLLRLYEEDVFPSDASRNWVRFNLDRIRVRASQVPKPTKKIQAKSEKPLKLAKPVKPAKAPAEPKIKAPAAPKVKPTPAPKPPKAPRVKKDPDAKYTDPAKMESGTYSGRKMAFMAEKHSVYLLRQYRFNKLTPAEREWVENNLDEIKSKMIDPSYVMTLKIHEGKTMEQILHDEPMFLVWVGDNMAYNSKARKWVEANWDRVLQALEDEGFDVETLGLTGMD